MPHFLMEQHHRQPTRAPGAREFPDIPQGLLEDVTIEEDEGIQGLVLCGRRHMALHRKVLEEARTSGAPMLAGYRTPWGCLSSDVRAFRLITVKHRIWIPV